MRSLNLKSAGILIAGIVVIGLLAGALLRPGGNDTAAPIISARVPKPQPQTFSGSAIRSDKLSRYSSVVARARHAAILVRRSPSTHSRATRLHERTLGKARLPLVLLVHKRRGKWLDVYLPTRPNLSRGWISMSDVRLARDDFRVEIQLTRHRLIAWDGKHRVATERIATGKALTPTPTGTYYLTDLIRPPDPKGFYGPYAFGLSAHSPILTSFEGGDGQVGIHGTNEPSALGGNVSHGCIRVRNAAIRRLARLLPLGTPVQIRRA
jgi:lipoprotein-anchoring transpeptidase ErfK/SrfK